MGVTLHDKDVVALDLIPTTAYDPRLLNLLVLKKWCQDTFEGEVYLKLLQSGTIRIWSSVPAQSSLAIFRKVKASIGSEFMLGVCPPSLHSIKGVIHCKEPNTMTVHELTELLEDQQVFGVMMIVSSKDPEAPITSAILSFTAKERPRKVMLSWEKVNVEPYDPLPSRCNRCQKFRHHSITCKAEQVCPMCAMTGHVGTTSRMAVQTM